jgi:hypothetical protein
VVIQPDAPDDRVRLGMEFRLSLFFKLARQTEIQEREEINAVALLQHQRR